MELALNEVKTQAKKLLKVLRAGKETDKNTLLALKRLALNSTENIQLKHCLSIVSQILGFDNWHHAQYILSGNKKPEENIEMGSFFYTKGCNGFINEWFADYQQAEEVFSAQIKNKWLLPYKSQFIVVKQDYIQVFKLDNATTSLWSKVNNNMVESYNSKAWDKLACEIIKNRVRNY